MSPRTQVILCTTRQMQEACTTHEAMDWCEKWNKEVDESIRHPIIQEAIDYFVKKGKDPEYGRVCLRIWKKQTKTSRTKADMVCSEDPPTDQP